MEEKKKEHKIVEEVLQATKALDTMTDEFKKLQDELDNEVAEESHAIPELHPSEPDTLASSEDEIDYSGAIPEIHFRKKK